MRKLSDVLRIDLQSKGSVESTFIKFKLIPRLKRDLLQPLGKMNIESPNPNELTDCINFSPSYFK